MRKQIINIIRRTFVEIHLIRYFAYWQKGCTFVAYQDKEVIYFKRIASDLTKHSDE